jgi:hypothetical protein
VQWAPKNGQNPQNFENVMWPVTQWMLVDVFFIWEESSMSVRRDDFARNAAYVSVVWNDVRI